ncbi:MAG: 23S rRNA (adenine(2503)-C(2))-methyltransferase RlmN [Bacteroidales bacterium]|nr:23S rRNA (adenine(2503)-C(2))-methyltransferase RlmN [Bacteroidales bacterium]
MSFAETIVPKEHLLGKTLPDLKRIAAKLGLPAFVAAQIAYWLYKTNIQSYDEMTNISKKVRLLLAEHYDLGVSDPVKVQQSADGTKKYLFPVSSHKFIETAFIPDARRNTLCVSSQVGCKMGCLFCATGRQGFQAQLSAGQIINQLRSIPEREQITNIVFMGMGEPFDNAEEVMKAQEILTAAYGFELSARKVTVSTIGIVPAMEVFLRESKCNLAVSMHSPFDEERRKLMPIQHVYPIKDVIDTINRADLGKYRRVSIEYIVFGELNDTQKHVKELARLLNKTRCRINLIRFHPVPNVPLPPTNEDRLVEFQRALNEKGIVTTIRASRGLDIDAACGLLSTKALIQRENGDF